MPVLIRAQHAVAPLCLPSRGSSALADDLRELLGPSLVSCTPRELSVCARNPSGGARAGGEALASGPGGRGPRGSRRVGSGVDVGSSRPAAGQCVCMQ